MLYAIAVVLIVLWLLGLATSYTMGGFIHILLAIAIISVPGRFISGKKVLWLPFSPLVNPGFIATGSIDEVTAIEKGYL